MRIHILGICGTFMSGVALLAKELGAKVTGSDANVYPPMSDQLKNQGIEINEGYEVKHLDQVDCVLVGNVIKRGNPAIEHILSNRIPYLSGPEWLAKNVLKTRKVLAVAGTHGKTTTTSLLTWILDSAKLSPGFLIGGIPENFGVSARLGCRPFFVIEADEYDSAFFDKRSKFIHYCPQTLILNNLEYDHADIFPNLAAIKQQFHYLIRTIPNNGLIIYYAKDSNLADLINQGCWTPQVTFGSQDAIWQAKLLVPDGSAFKLFYEKKLVGEVHWDLLGKHNVNNALAAIAAAYQAGVNPKDAIKSLAHFKNVKRRLEIKKKINDIVIYDDFAHHPTAIETTLAGLRAKVGLKNRIVVVLEFGSYTMRSGIHKDYFKKALKRADLILCKNSGVEWGLRDVLASFKQPTGLYDDVNQLIKELIPKLQNGDHIVIMSNTGFENIHQKLISALENG